MSSRVYAWFGTGKPERVWGTQAWRGSSGSATRVVRMALSCDLKESGVTTLSRP